MNKSRAYDFAQKAKKVWTERTRKKKPAMERYAILSLKERRALSKSRVESSLDKLFGKKSREVGFESFGSMGLRCRPAQ